MRILAIGVALAASMNAAAHADTLIDCLKKENPAVRYMCYSKLTITALSAEKENSVETNWVVEVNKSQIDGKTDVQMHLISEDEASCQTYNPQEALLGLRCENNTTQIFFGAVGCDLRRTSRSDYARILIRLDDDEPYETNYHTGTLRAGAGHWSGLRAIPLIKRMLGKKKLAVRFTPLRHRSFETVFNITGIEEAIKPLREECGW